ncbi:MAG: redoxin domain-containing protein, partial [Deltaproteobacteria bacterium]|nr:redoxin domain-containing protein [Deltaproteobacteria bacterium]
MEGCGYRDQYDAFEALGVQIVGVSTASPAEHQSWAEQEGFQYELWQDDARGALAARYGADDGWFGAYSRITVLLDADD